MKKIVSTLYVFTFLINLLFSQDEITQLGDFNPNTFAELLDVELYSPDTIYTVGVGGFFFIDVTNKSNPLKIGRYDPGTIFKRFYNGSVADSIALGAARLDGLYLLDINDLTRPALHTIYNNQSFSYESVEVYDKFAYCAVHENGIEIIDISNPKLPFQVGQISNISDTWDVFIQDDLLFIADGSQGAKIYSLADPVHPDLISAFTTNGYAKEIVISDGNAFIALGASGFDIFDITNISNPQILSHFNKKTGIVNHLSVSNNYVFTANWEIISAIDISDRSNPKLVATENTPVRAMGIEAFDNNIYVADWATVRLYNFFPISNPDIHVKPTQHDFGYKSRGQSITKEFEIFNLGEATLVVDSVIVTENSFNEPDDPSDNYFQVNNSSFTIASNKSQNLSVTYHPTTQDNAASNLIIYSNDNDESLKIIQLYGGGDRPADGTLAHDFTLQNLNHNNVTLSDYRGKVILLAMFASW